ncbi:MAG TPA: CBS domain-containing protein [Epulopiscium sp.]|nr:CBS domain-containing protein [Candidatus Epulonipiscium sp.]
MGEEGLSNSQKFLAIYNELDDFMRQDLNEEHYVSHSDMLYKIIKKGNSVFDYYYQDLKSFSRLRNAIVHNPDKRTADPIAEPHDDIVKQYQELLDKVVSPELALDRLAIPVEKLYTVTPNTNVLKAMKIMNKNIFTYVPVLEKRKFIGVFSDSTLFDYIIKCEGAIIDEKLAIRDLGEVIHIHNHATEAFVFVNKETTVIGIEEIFRKGFKHNKRIAVVLITADGTQTGELLGLVSAWEVAGYNIT